MAEDEKENKSLFNFTVSNLVGLEKPLTKLIETLNAAGGRLSDGVREIANVGWLDKKRTENQAHHIRTIGAAQTDTNIERAKAIVELAGTGQAQLQSMNLDADNTSATLIGVPIEIKQLQERANKRVMFENVLHELNRDAVTDFAAQALRDEESVSDEPVDIDWTHRLYNIAQDASTEEMQALFGKILAGEIKRPGSYSIRTLEVLRNLDSKEAALFKHASSLVADGFRQGVLVTSVSDKTEDLLEINGIDYEGVMKLVDAGLIMNPATSASTPAGVAKTITTFGKTGIYYEFLGQQSYVYRGYPLTTAGFQLYQLIKNEVSPPMSIIEEMARGIMASGGVNLKLVTNVIRHDNGVNWAHSTSLDYLKV